jgi:hypothetical protein
MKGKYLLCFEDMHSDLRLMAWWPEERSVPTVGTEIALLTSPEAKQPKMAKVKKVMEFYAIDQSIQPPGGRVEFESWSKQIFLSIELRDLSPSDMPKALSALLVEGNKANFPS